MIYKKNYIYISLIIFFLIPSCKSFEPGRPEENYLDVKDILEKQLSIINIPVQYDLTNLENQVNKEVKELIFEENTLQTKSDSKYHIKVWKRDQITFNAVADVINISVPIKIWAKVGIDLSNIGIGFSQFKETQFEMNVNFFSKVGITPDWKVYTETTGNGFNWITKPKMKMGFVEIPLESFVGPMIDKQQDQIAKEIDKQLVKNLEIKNIVQDAWNKIQTPIELSKEHNAWLQLIPVEVLISPLMGQGKNTSLTVGFKAYTKTIIGEKPAAGINSDLPELKQQDIIPNEIAIGLSTEISHGKINDLLRQNLINKNFSYNDGKQNVKITSINFYGSGKNMVIKAGLEGSMKGTVYLKGIPYYDPVRQSLAIKDLDYDLDTKDKLIKTASWLAHGKFVKSLEDAIVYPLGKQIEEAKKAIESNITNKEISKGVFLNGEVEELVPSEILITPKTVIALVTARGKADIKIKDNMQVVRPK